MEYMPAFLLIIATMFVWTTYATRQHGWAQWQKGYDQGAADMSKSNWERRERRYALERAQRLADCTCGREAKRQATEHRN